MENPRFIEIDGKRYLWRELVARGKAQMKALPPTSQPFLFDVRDDCRPATQRSAAGRYQQPTLFEMPETTPRR